MSPLRGSGVWTVSDGVVYRVSGTETVAVGCARRRATHGKRCSSLKSHHVSGAESCLPGVQIDSSFDSPHRLRGAPSNAFLSVGSASTRATHGYPLGTAKRGTSTAVRCRLRPKMREAAHLDATATRSIESGAFANRPCFPIRVRCQMSPGLEFARRARES
jgi:hypothetical protein